MAESVALVRVIVWGSVEFEDPTVIVGRDKDQVDFCAALASFHRVRDDPNFSQVLIDIPFPEPAEWTDAGWARDWLSELATYRGFGPVVFNRDLDVPMRADDQAIHVGVAHATSAPARLADVVVGADRVGVERDLAQLMLTNLRHELRQDGVDWAPPMGDPSALARWLGHVHDDSSRVSARVTPATLVAGIEATTDLPRLVDPSSWLNAVENQFSPQVRVIAWEHGVLDADVIVGRSLADADRRVMAHMLERFTTSGDPDEQRFVAVHPIPVDWTDHQGVAHWVEAAQDTFSLPIAAVVPRPRPAGRQLYVGVVEGDNGLFDPERVFVDTQSWKVERGMAGAVSAQVEQMPDFSILDAPDFSSPTSVSAWLEQVHLQMPKIGFIIHGVWVPEVPQFEEHLIDDATATMSPPNPTIEASTPPVPSAETVRLYVNLISWEAYGQSAPEVLIGRDSDELDRRTGLRVFERVFREPSFEGARQFLATHPGPSQWESVEDVWAWERDLATIDGPVVKSTGDVHTVPQTDRHPVSVYVGVSRLGGAPASISDPVVTVDLVDAERQVAEHMSRDFTEMARDGHQAPEPPNFDDPDAVSEWLRQVSEDWDITVSIDQLTLPPAPVTLPPVTVEQVTVAPAVMPSWSAIIAWGPGPENSDVFVAGSEMDAALAAATSLASLIDEEGSEQEAAQLHALGDPTQLDNPDDVRTWLSKLTDRDGAPRVVIKRTTPTPALTSDTDVLPSLPSLPTGRQHGIYLDMTKTITSLSEWAEAMGEFRRFIDSHGYPSVEGGPAGALEWLKDMEHYFPVSVSVAIIDRDDDPDTIETILGTSPADVRRKTAQSFYDTRSPSPFWDVFPGHGDPSGFTDDGVKRWLADYLDQPAVPTVRFVDGLDGARLQTRVMAALQETTLGFADPRLAPQKVGKGQVAIDTERPGLWETINNGGIPDMLIADFPDEPDQQKYVTCGVFDTQGYDIAEQEWMDTVFDLSRSAQSLSTISGEADHLTVLGYQLAKHLKDHSIPAEPKPEDYPAIAPTFRGEYDKAAFDYHHRVWQADLVEAVKQRESFLTRLVDAMGLSDQWELAPDQKSIRRIDPARVLVTETAPATVKPEVTMLSAKIDARHAIPDFFTGPMDKAIGFGLSM